MTRSRTATITLALAASSSCLMGAYHFFLPSMFHWDRFVTKVPGAIRWGLFSINLRRSIPMKLRCRGSRTGHP
jgi:hypothetical protein